MHLLLCRTALAHDHKTLAWVMIPLLRLKTNITALRNKKHLPVAPLEISNHPQIFFSCFSTAFDLLNCVTHVWRLHVTPSHRAHRMASNTQLYSVSFTAFVEITDMQFFQTRALFSKFSQEWIPAGPATGSQCSLSSSPCHTSLLATTCCHVASPGAGQENLGKKVRKQ